jgi:glycosyltransferase involved in cell wall biosynthesis
MSKLVTVIIPTIGREQLLKASIKSVLYQTYHNIEILLSDNASPINVGNVIHHLADERIRLVTRNSRLDYISHIKLCIKEAKGEYLMILSDDDLISPDYIENLVRAFDASDDVVAGFTPQKILREDEMVLGEAPPCVYPSAIDGWKFLQMFMLGKIAVPMYSFVSLFTRRKLVVCSGLIEEFSGGSDGSHVDNYLLFSLAMKGRVVITDGLFGYRVHADSTGLQTPFVNLFLASKAYEKKILCLLSTRVTIFSKKYTLYKWIIKASLAEMLLVRLKKYYVHRERTLVSNYYFLRVLSAYPICVLYFISFGKSNLVKSIAVRLRNFLMS